MFKSSLRVLRLAVPAALVFLTACSKNQDTIKIGEYASLSGKEASLGQSSHQGTLLAIERINAAGGVLGKQLELIVEDTQSKAGESGTAVRKLRTVTATKGEHHGHPAYSDNVVPPLATVWYRKHS